MTEEKPEPRMRINPSQVLPDGTPLAVKCSECGESFEIDRRKTELSKEAIRAAFQAVFDEHVKAEHLDVTSSTAHLRQTVTMAKLENLIYTHGVHGNPLAHCRLCWHNIDSPALTKEGFEAAFVEHEKVCPGNNEDILGE